MRPISPRCWPLVPPYWACAEGFDRGIVAARGEGEVLQEGAAGEGFGHGRGGPFGGRAR